MTELSFHFPGEHLDAVIKALMQLPAHLKPQQFGYSEGIKNDKDMVADEKRFHAFLRKAASGFFLYLENTVYSFRINKSGEFTVDADGINAEEASILLRHLGPVGASFAYAADSAERKHRNRLIKNAEYGIHEAWVGRDWRRYIPGLYWLTLIPQSLADQHGVLLGELKKAAVEAEEIAPKLWLLRFFDAPENWQVNAERLDEICSTTKGMFSITPVRTIFEKTTTFLGAAAVLREWS
ncbi:hypothetical protein FCE95_09465 [Luteimonas gilva]|uniref:Uncharacterized protein n=1 Tax=Luteimonas gilva TaxID=2572684 RepID=A0A4U5JL97_9GAMM|nr:hypothetical protein [Luteimonas gilva]TKR30352.1 hypothetical protein FCE95_09465 [Luteimonas gilva]